MRSKIGGAAAARLKLNGPGMITRSERVHLERRGNINRAREAAIKIAK